MDIQNSTPSPASKRPGTEVQEPENKTQRVEGPAPLFLVLHSTGQVPLSRLSPFAIQKGLVGMAGPPKSVKKLRSGDLLVEMSTARHSELLMRSTTLADIPITVAPHQSLNSCRGVIEEPDLIYDSEESLKIDFRDQGVTDVRRIKFRKDGEYVNSRVIILTFNTPRLPSHVIAGYLFCEVRPYIPNPLRCFQCQRYGHSKTSCRGIATCARCALPDHDMEACKVDPPKCINCNGPHPAYSRSCPKWKEEKTIQEVKTKNHISYPEARRLVTPSTNKSYASVVKATVSVAVQTDISVPPSESFAPMAKYILKTTPKTADQSTATPVSVNPCTTVSVLRAPKTATPPPKPTLLIKQKNTKPKIKKPTNSQTMANTTTTTQPMDCDGSEVCSSIADAMDVDQARVLHRHKNKIDKTGTVSSKPR